MQLDNGRGVGMIVMIATQDGSVQVTGTRAGNVMLVNFLGANKKLAPIVLLENICLVRGLQHATIVTQARVLMVKPPVATTVRRGHMLRTQEVLARIVRKESIMIIKSNQHAKTVLRARIIRTQG